MSFVHDEDDLGEENISLRPLVECDAKGLLRPLMLTVTGLALQSLSL